MVSPPRPLGPNGKSLAPTNVAGDNPGGVFHSTLHADMEAFDRLPLYWRDWLRRQPVNFSAVQLTQKLQAQGILK